ncbi:MAG: hypothetical protein WEC14_06665 [Chloroflexota bacterium]
MDRATRNLFAVLLVVVIAATGGAALILGGGPGRAQGPPTDAATSVGVIVGVDAEGLGDVRSFRLRGTDGTVATYALDRLQNGTAFPPSHLAEHQVTAEPVRVWYQEGNGTRYAIWLDDADR